ncbi:DUF3368 domain-containing protein [Scytonema sp. UIC 10036]|uniref:DUF3368 domain-containing protein n=1 Tax=Scytonema sp. UIC 10036 TaxID=2304196 RepID=UPI001384A7CA|nr:DUF3368 domain-containing protein [Scytonema sp. UIC 10036]
MIVVSDTTPLSELAKVGHLLLLKDVSRRIIIPTEVYNELIAADNPLITAVPLENWIEVRQVIDTQKVVTLRATKKIGLGECAAITLAEEIGATRILVDDLAARREALARGLSVIGTVGILIIAKQQGLIPSIKEVLDDLIANGTYISQQLYQQALTAVGE